MAEGINSLFESDVVLMDMIFSEATNSVSDSRLSESLENLNASVCGFFLRQSATQTIDNDSLDILSDSSLDLLQSQIAQEDMPQFAAAPYAEINILPLLESCSLSGSFSTVRSSDDKLREYPISIYFKDTLYPSLAVQGLRLLYNKDAHRVNANTLALNAQTILLNRDSLVRLNFYKKEDYDIVSFLDLIEGRVSSNYFQNKIVILGITEVGAGDIVNTPIGAIPGPLLHYTFLSNFLEGHLIMEAEYIGLFLTFLMSFLPLLLLVFIRTIVPRVIINIVSYGLLYICIRYLFIAEMIYIDLFYPLAALLLSMLSIEAIAFSYQEKNSQFLHGAFSSYLSEDLLHQLIENPKALSLGGEKKELSILFSDIRGFTTISESMDAQSLVLLLNRYFTPMTHAVLEHKGMLDKYIGDAVMAFFNAPVDVENHADEACLSALEMIQRLKALNDELEKEEMDAICIGIGINTAEVVVKGKDEAVLLYELLEGTSNTKEIKKIYTTALQFYKDNNLIEAKNLFLHLVEKYNDKVSLYFLKKIEENKVWGIQKMDTK